MKVKPNAKRPGVEERDGMLLVSVDEPPVKNRANRRLIELLSEYYKKPRSSIIIKSGFRSRIKTIIIEDD